MGRIGIVSLGAMIYLSATQALGDKEDWYTYWSAGFSNNNYPADMERTFNEAESLGFDRIQISIDAFGFYWPLEDQKTINGFVVSGTNDTLSKNGLDVSLKTYLYSYSIMHFFGSEAGDGFFLRGDVGLSKGVVTAESSYGSESSTSDFGSGFLIGAGYGIPISSESRLILSFSYTSKTIEEESYSATMFSVGGLW